MGTATQLGRWILDRPVHEGPWVVVWRAHAIADPGDLAAIKLPAADAPPWVAERLRRERDWLAGLSNPGFVSLREGGSEPGVWLCLEWLPRPALDPLPDLQGAVRLITETASALAYLHDMGLVHGDLRSEHLRLAPDGTLRIIDFASVEPAGSIPGLVGPPEYLPPERFGSEGRALPAADVYALGVILHEMLGGTVPEGRGAKKPALDPGEEAPANLRDLVRHATDPDPGRRITSAAFAASLLTPSGATDAPNRAGRYEIRGVMRRVDAGMIFRAFDPVLHREVVVRFGTGRPRPERSARAARLDHPGIIRTLDHGESTSGPYIVSEMMDAATLLDRVTQRGRMPVMEAVRVGIHLGKALAHAHSHEIVHGALSLDDVLLDMTGLPKLAGIALGPGGPPSVDVKGLAALIRDLSASMPQELAALLDRASGGEAPVTMDVFVGDLRSFLEGSATVSPQWRWYVLAAVMTVTVMIAVASAPSFTQRAFERDASEHLASVEADINRRLAAADPAGADLAFAAWASEGAWRGTRAFAEGRMHQAEHLIRRGERDRAIRAYAEAYFEVEDSDVRTRALLGLGRAFRDGWRWAELEALVARLGAVDPTTLDSDEVRGWSRTLAFARHTPPESLEPGIESILGQLTRSEQRLPFEADSLVRLGGDRALVIRGSRAVGVAKVGRGGLSWDHTLGAPGARMGWDPVGGAGDQNLLLARDGPANRLYQFVDGELRPVFSWNEGSPATAAWRADLDGDGQSEIYVGIDSYARRLISLVPRGDSFDIREPYPPGNRLNSAVKDLFVADLAGDGRRELAVAQAEWGAFDVRVLRPRGPSDPPGDPLILSGRVKLGAVDHLIAMPRRGAGTEILALKTDSWPSALMFPPEQPNGAPRGAYLLTWDGAGLKVSDSVASPLDCQDGLGGDFDGDGFGEAALVCGKDALILSRGADGKLTSGVIRGVAPRFAVDLDGDGQDELIVNLPDDTTGALWVLGLGSEKIPVAPVLAVQPVPEGDEDLRARFSRAEDLLTMGLRDEAVQSLLVVADLALQTPLGTAALRRAAEMYTIADRCHDAEPILIRLADSEPGAWDATESAARCAAQERRYGAELAFVDRLQATESAPLRVRHEAQSRVREMRSMFLDPPVTIGFAGGLPPAVVPLDPMGVRAIPSVGLGFTSSTRDLLRVPVRWEGGPVEVAAELDLARLEWAGQLRIHLVSRDDPAGAYGVAISAIGGGQYLKTELRCLFAGENIPVGWDDRGALGETRRASLTFTSDDLLGTWGCSAEGDIWRERLHRSARIEPARPAAGDYDLLVTATSTLQENHPVVGGVLRSLTLRGLQVRAETAGALDGPRRSIVVGSPAIALQDPALSTVGIERLIALDDTGDRVGVARVLPDYLAQNPLSPIPLMRLRRATLAPMLREILGVQAWQRLFSDAWLPVVISDPSDPSGTAAFTEDLLAVDPSVEPNVAAVLFLHRGNAWVRRGGRATARLDYQAAAATGDDRATRAAALVEIAALDVAERHAEDAKARLTEAIATSPTPVLLADALAVRPELEPLHAEPFWEDVVVRARCLSE